MEEIPRKKKDLWDKADVILKAIGILLISGAITFYGYYTENRRGIAKLYTDALTAHLASDSAKQQTLLKILTERYFEEKNPERKLLILEMLAFNFQEILHLKPLFLDFASGLDPSSAKLARLHSVVIGLKLEQVNRLVADGAERHDLTGKLGQEIEIDVPGTSEITLGSEGGERPWRVKFKVGQISNDVIVIEAAGPKSRINFSVTEYDIPSVDSMVIEHVRFAFVLWGVYDQTASITVLRFPLDYFESRDRLKIEKLIGKYLKESR